MSVSDIVIVASVAVIVFLCVRSVHRANKEGECGTCALESTCTVHDTGRCKLSDDIMARADAAVANYEAKKATGQK